MIIFHPESAPVKRAGVSTPWQVNAQKEPPAVSYRNRALPVSNRRNSEKQTGPIRAVH